MKKLFLIFFSILIVSSKTFAMEKLTDKAMYKINAKRAMLTKLREGDFAHAGDREAIEFVLSKISMSNNIKNGNVLDLGSGYGGTADYCSAKGFKKIWGVDIDKNAVDYANLKYPQIKFLHLDAMNLNKKFRKDFFSFVYMFNVIYAIENKDLLIRNLSKVSKKGAILAIFDYSKLKKEDPNQKKTSPPLKDFSGLVMHPIEPDSLAKIITQHGWKIMETSDITDKYIMWYEQFLNELSQKRSDFAKTYNEKNVEDVENLFNKILFNLKSGEIGGVLMIAQKL